MGLMDSKRDLLKLASGNLALLQVQYAFIINIDVYVVKYLKDTAEIIIIIIFYSHHLNINSNVL